ncbi:MAG TPA: DUF6445 family protein [Terriglobia bacterium]|nr:DUF6445 family protein [Terriglobia bacterium]
MRRIQFNSDFQMSVATVGRECSPIVCIDSFVANPGALLELASEAAFIDVGSRYPGVRAPAPESYADNLLMAAAEPIEKAFGLPPRELELCAFSIVTTSPDRLRPIQRIPHFDGPDPSRIAFIHYLCDPQQGGTSFYRHRSTGLFEVTLEHMDLYQSTIVDELKTHSPVHAYAIDHTQFFERLHGVEAAFNRLIIYRGNALHSGDISARTVLSEDPRKGRLTINGFGFLRTKSH